MKKLYKSLIPALIILTLFVIAYLRNNTQDSKVLKKSGFLMGTFMDVTVEGTGLDDDILSRAFELAAMYDSLLSAYNSSGYVARLNRGGKGKYNIDNSIKPLFELSERVYISSEGAFDPSMMPLIELYDFDKKIMPEEDAIRENLKLKGYKNVELIEDSLYIKKDSLMLNYSAAAKGFIVDKVAEYLEQAGATRALINAGGEIRFFSGEKPWRVGIKNPRNKGIIGIVTGMRGAVATSGDYEKYFMKDGDRIHHIINPKDGLPSGRYMSITVLDTSCAAADAFATALFNMEELPNKVKYIAVDSLGNINTNTTGNEGLEILYENVFDSGKN